jgi:hypothetical protein
MKVFNTIFKLATIIQILILLPVFIESFKVERAYLGHKIFNLHFQESTASLFTISSSDKTDLFTILHNNENLLEADGAENIINIPIKVTTDRLEVQTNNPINFFLWRGGLTMPLAPKNNKKSSESIAEDGMSDSSDVKDDRPIQSVPTKRLNTIREFITGEFTELRCNKENRAALTLEQKQHFFEIDIGKQLEQEQVMEDDTEIPIKVDLVFDFYDEWEDDSLFLIEKNNSYFYQSSHKNCKGSLSKAKCAEQLKDTCRKTTPDSLGHTYSFNLLYRTKDGLKLRISISRDKSGSNPESVEEDQSDMEFALGLYALFVYRK